jgi:hypothetical protein
MIKKTSAIHPPAKARGILAKIDKTNRWLSFIQCVMTVYGFTNVENERNITRPMFNEYYKKNNINIPKTLDF